MYFLSTVSVIPSILNRYARLYYLTFKSYLLHRHFIRKVNVKSGVSHSPGSVLRSTLYLIFTPDLPATGYTAIGTFPDDTAVLTIHDAAASLNLHNHFFQLSGHDDDEEE